MRAQLNPHFLFNSINNIYVLLDENKDKASDILLKFSDLLRYQLYDCNVKEISLDQELQFLENFIGFENLRYSNKLKVNYDFGQLRSQQLMIAPLLLQPFIENAFKHTPKSKTAQNSINIKAVMSGCNLTFEVSNTFEQGVHSSLPGGIGLENVRKRLQLLYPGKHELQITHTQNIYSSRLLLKLSND